MIFAVLFMIIFLIVISVIFTFLFDMLVASLHNQNIAFNKPIFSENEIRVKPSLVERFENAGDEKAVVMCSSKRVTTEKRFTYDGPKSCALFMSLCNSEHDCKFGCLGFGDCLEACSRNAIKIENKTAVISRLCNGCGKCISRCPKGIIKLVPANTESFVLCSSNVTENTKCSDNLKEKELHYGKNSFFSVKRIFKLKERN